MAEDPTATVEATWEGGFKFVATDEYGHSVIVDAPESDGESFDGLKPGEMLLTSLATCSGIDVVTILRKERQELSGLSIRIKGVQEPDPPWRWREMELEYTVRGRNLDPGRVERAIHLTETKYCSIGATLSASVDISSNYRIVEA